MLHLHVAQQPVVVHHHQHHQLSSAQLNAMDRVRGAAAEDDNSIEDGIKVRRKTGIMHTAQCLLCYILVVACAHIIACQDDYDAEQSDRSVGLCVIAEIFRRSMDLHRTIDLWHIEKYKYIYICRRRRRNSEFLKLCKSPPRRSCSLSEATMLPKSTGGEDHPRSEWNANG